MSENIDMIELERVLREKAEQDPAYGELLAALEDERTKFAAAMRASGELGDEDLEGVAGGTAIAPAVRVRAEGAAVNVSAGSVSGVSETVPDPMAAIEKAIEDRLKELAQRDAAMESLINQLKDAANDRANSISRATFNG